MADLEKTVAIIFEGVDQMGAGVDSATKRIDNLSDNVEAIAAPLATGTKALLAFEAAALTMAVALGSRAYDSAVKFESAQAELAKTLGENDGSVDQFTRQITELSNTYGESSTDLLSSMANYKQAGFTAEEALGLVKSGLDLVIAGDLEAAQASEVLVATLKGFKAPASDANQLLEVLNASSNTYATNVDQLSQGMARLSPIADAMGLSFEETAELLIPVIEVFRSGPEAANALRTGLLRLGDDSKPVTAALESIGVAQRDSNGVLRDSSAILLDVANATGDLADSEKLFVAQQLFGIEQSAKMVTVLDSLFGSTVDVNQAMEESASVSEEVAIRLGTAEKAGDRARESFENLARTLGMEFKDEMAGISSAMTDVFIQFESAAADGALDEFFAAITPTLDEIRRLALEVAEALPEALAGADYSGFSQGMAALFGDLENVSVSADDLQRVIEALGGTFKSLSEFTAGTIEVFKGVAGALAPVIEAFLSLDGDTQKLIGTIGGISLVVGPAAGVLGGLTKAVSALAGKGGVIALGLPRIRDLVGVLGKNSGLAAVAFIAGESIWEMHKRLEEFNKEPINLSDKLKKDLEEVENIQGDEFSLFNVENLAAGVESLRQHFGWGEEAAEDFQIFGSEAEKAAIEVANLGGDAEDAEGSIKEMGDTAGDSAEKISTIKQAAIDAALQVASLGEGEEEIRKLDIAAVDAALSVAKIGETNESINVLSADIDDTSRFVRGLDGNLIEVGKSISVMGGAAKEAGKDVEDGGEKFSEFEKTLLELESNEKIKAMEFTASIAVAGLEADAQKVEAVMGSLATTVDSTSQVLDGLFSDRFGNDDLSRWDEVSLDSAIRKQEEAQQEAIGLQNELARQQIASLKARTEAMRNGEGLIKIDSTGLEPALEMILWEILEKIQLRANAEGAEFLLGLNGSA
ncbi:phage tail tape measure protein [Halomonas ramblicola]|uniref:phage tail tape measure protein n=1 Tax=Halomonas ramblicola TaxID=747349 RepID=UPI0025B5AAF8|nr:phage tail tape measure protein [Halomonas ramblicola]MDN3521516.1 phage tail tape measure protein [Halomonas ramblicola]